MSGTDYEFVVSETEESAEATSSAEYVPGSDVDEDALKKWALRLWSDEERCAMRLAPILYELCKKLSAQGKKGKGFRAWLKENGKNKTTAYRWIRDYAKKNGLELPYAHPSKKEATSSHVGQSTKTTAEPATKSIGNPDWYVSQMNVSEQIALLGIGSFADVLKKAKELIETPGEEFHTAKQSFNPETQEEALYGDPNYHWSPQANAAEVVRAQAYMTALKTVVKALKYEVKRANTLMCELQDYVQKLNDINQPCFFQTVPKPKAAIAAT